MAAGKARGKGKEVRREREKGEQRALFIGGRIPLNSTQLKFIKNSSWKAKRDTWQQMNIQTL